MRQMRQDATKTGFFGFVAVPAGLCLLICAVLAQPARAADWPQWRGPGHDGVSSESGWADRWPAGGPPIAWKANVGTGFSSFAVAQGRVFTAGNSDNMDTVFCLDADSGKVLWKHSYPADLGDKFFEGGTTGTPVVDGDRAYFLGRWGEVFCFDAASGKVAWSTNVHKEVGDRIPGWGFGGSPLVFKDLLVLNVGEAGLAMEKATGKVVWHSASKDAGYSTPVPMQHGGQWFAVLGSGQSFLAVNLQTGKEAWRIRWLTEYGVNAADPIVDGDRVMISSGYGKGAALLKIGDAGSAPKVLWKNREMRTELNAAVRVGPYVYGIDVQTPDNASLKCIDLATGAEKWAQPDVGLGALMVADGRLIVLGEHGELMIAPATPAGFNATARARVLGGKCWTVPVLANGRIYCRNARGDVVCVDVRK